MSKKIKSEERDQFYQKYAEMRQEGGVLTIAHVLCTEWLSCPSPENDLDHYESGYFINGQNNYFRTASFQTVIQ